MSVSAEAGNRTGSKRECLPSESDCSCMAATDYGPNRPATDFMRRIGSQPIPNRTGSQPITDVSGVTDTSAVLIACTYGLCHVPGTSTVTTVDYVGSK